ICRATTTSTVPRTGPGSRSTGSSLCSSESLDKTEDLLDVAGYLAQWVGLIVARNPDIEVLERLASADALPVVIAMTTVNHPCDVLSDLYALSRDADIAQLRYLFVGAVGNIAGAWWGAARAFGLD